MQTVSIALITDRNYVTPTITAIYSIIKNKRTETKLHFYLVTADLEPEQEELFMGLEQEKVLISVVKASASKYEGLHTSDPNAPCVASIAALLKFDLPDMLSELDKVLYLDGDLIVREDLTELFGTELSDNYVAAVVDSGSIYYKHDTVKKVDDYFNSGVMLLNLKEMRKDGVTARLIEEKKKGDSHLMDQNVFNIVFNKKVSLLPIRYNLLYVNLLRAAGKYTIGDINARYGTSYFTLYDLEQDAAIIHYSSKDKPWKTNTAPLSSEWQAYFEMANALYGFAPKEEYAAITRSMEEAPKISVIIPVFNTGDYLYESLDSVINQSFKDIEIICVNDGSTDNSLSILEEYQKKDERVSVFSQSNKGQSAARNVAIENARGEYIYFFDSDDILMPGALDTLYHTATERKLDLLLFDGNSFFEDEEMEETHSHYLTHYIRNKSYPDTYRGGVLYAEMVANADYKVSPCLQFIKSDYLKATGVRFYEGIIYEDNLFALQMILFANRVAHIPAQLFNRRVRSGSTMTSRPSFRNFRAYFICLLQMNLFIYENNFSEEVVATAHKQFNYFLKTVASCYSNLPQADKRKPWVTERKARLFADILYDAVVQASDREKTGLVSYNEYVAIHKSWSYRIGRFITWLPRKIRGGIRCLKEHGWKYTFDRFLVALHLRKDPYK